MKKEKVINAPNLAKVLHKKHENKWVVLSRDYKQVLAVGDTLADVAKAAPGKDKVIMNTHPLFTPYAPLISSVR